MGVKVPVTVALYSPPVDDANVHDTPTLPPDGIAADAGHDTVSPDGLEDVLRSTVPEKPNRLVNVKVAVVDCSDMNETLDGAEMLKS